PTTIYAAVAGTGSAFGHLLGLYKTTDSGMNWTRLNNTPDYCAAFQQCWYDITVAVDPVNANVVYSGGEEFTNLFQTLDGGTCAYRKVHPNVSSRCRSCS